MESSTPEAPVSGGEAPPQLPRVESFSDKFIRKVSASFIGFVRLLQTALILFYARLV